MRIVILFLSAVVAALFSSPALGQTVAHWRMDGGKDGEVAKGGNSIIDSTGGHHGTPVGKLVYRGVKTPQGEATGLEFDGASGRIYIPDHKQFAIAGSLTVEACFLVSRHVTPPATDIRPILFYGDDRRGLDPYFLCIREDTGCLLFSVCDNRDTHSNATSPQPIPEGVLIHAAGTLDANTGDQKLFINGLLVASTRTDIRPLGALEQNLNPGLGIGARQSGMISYAFNGIITEVRISNVALDPSQFLINTRAPLRRSKEADTLILTDGNSLQGEIAIGAFDVESAVGPLKLSADQLVGMALQEDGIAKFYLLDGQAVCGKAVKARLTLVLRDGTRREFPFHGVKEWSYKISDARPVRMSTPPALLVLPSGDELTFDFPEPALTLHTAIGDVKLRAADLKELTFKGIEGVRATFTNGSTLAGVLDRSKFKFALKLGPDLGFDPDKVSYLRFNNPGAACAWLARVRLVGGDELVGCVTQQKLKLQTSDGPLELDILSIASLTATGGEAVQIKCWDGTIHQGKLESGKIGLTVAPGLELLIPTGLVAAMSRFAAVREDLVPKRVEELVALLGADKFKAREEATKELSRMGPAIAELLRKYRDHNDLEVRHRIDLILGILEKLSQPDNPA